MRIKETSSWSYITPNVTLQSEWDIESLIIKLYKKLNMKFVFKHVKSHQDNEAPIASLSLETRLSIKSDKLATKYMQEDRTADQL
jgi:hypothetical protein